MYRQIMFVAADVSVTLENRNLGVGLGSRRECGDEEFADPVNKKYPVSASKHVRAGTHHPLRTQP